MIKIKIIEEILERLNKATPGPWNTGNGTEDTLHEGENTVVCSDMVICSRYVYEGWERNGETYANMRLIAHAPEDIKHLLDQLAAMQEENKRLKKAYGNWKYEAQCEHDYAVSFMQQNTILTKALEEALRPQIENTCPSKDFKIAVECKSGWISDNEKCRKCWLDFVIKQAKSAIKESEADNEKILE